MQPESAVRYNQLFMTTQIRVHMWSFKKLQRLMLLKTNVIYAIHISLRFRIFHMSAPSFQEFPVFHFFANVQVQRQQTEKAEAKRGIWCNIFRTNQITGRIHGSVTDVEVGILNYALRYHFTKI